MFYAHAQKQTNKHNSLALAALPIRASSGSLWTISYSCCFQPFLKEQLLLLLFLFHRLAYSHLRHHNFLISNTAFFLLQITTLPPLSVYLS